MRVEMTAHISGTRDGKEWPRPGESVTLPDGEALALVAAGHAKPVDTAPPVEGAAVRHHVKGR